MLSKDKIVAVGKNKVLLYITSRYLTYGIQFVNSMYIAIALGPSYLAVWGFVNLILQYIAQFNFGVPYSLNVLLSINKTNSEKVQSLLSTSLVLYFILAAIIVGIVSVLYFLDIDIGDKYNFSSYVYIVILIAVFTHFNSLFTNYFRIQNQLGEIIFFQSVIPISMLIALFFAKGEDLLYLILWLMLAGQIISMFLYIRNSHLTVFKPTFHLVKLLLRKGTFLFIYNTCFYLIMLSTRTVVSVDYAVEEFGFFTFSFTLANTIMLLFDSFSFLIFPKTINRLNKASNSEIIRILDFIRVNYITSVHLAMYLFLIAFPFVIKLFPQYDSVFKSFGLMAMTVVLYSNCFGYSSFFTANGKERLLSLLSFITLCINILSALFISKVIKLDYSFVILATMLSYIIYSFMLSFFSFRIIGISYTVKSLLSDNFSPRLFIPFFISLIMIIFEVSGWGFALLLILFILLNRKQLADIKNTIRRIIHNPSIINI